MRNHYGLEVFASLLFYPVDFLLCEKVSAVLRAVGWDRLCYGDVLRTVSIGLAKGRGMPVRVICRGTLFSCRSSLPEDEQETKEPRRTGLFTHVHAQVLTQEQNSFWQW